jgi:N-acetylglucosaminyl-diphospho-decaprenol L-rhamnosyltransferase
VSKVRPTTAPTDEGVGKAAVSAVIVNWNCGANLRRCIDAIKKSRHVTIAEIIVVDNASSDGSVATVQEVEGVRVIQTGSNLGYGGGANRGLREARSEWVMILNPDVVLDEDAIERMVSYLDAELECGLVGPRLLDASGSEPGSCGGRPVLLDAIGRKFLLHMIFPYFNFRLKRPDFPTEVGWVTGACTVARRSALDSVGGFDEAIFMYFEDLDLSLRLRQGGWKVCFLPEAVGCHVGGESSKQVLDRMLLASEVSYRYFTRKHFGAVASGLLILLTPVEMALRSALWGTIYIFFTGRRREARTRLRAYLKAFLNDFDEAAPPTRPANIESQL